MTEAPRDAREIVHCACPRRDAADCVLARYGRNPEDEECECVCHDLNAEDDCGGWEADQ